MNRLRNYAEDRIILTDGSMGTYYSKKYDTERLPELDNVTDPEKIMEIHKEYIQAGAKFIRTNTYACNVESLATDMEGVKRNVRQACALAVQAGEACGKEIFVAGDIGPYGGEAAEHYKEIVKVFIEEKIDAIVFETFSSVTEVLEAAKYVKEHADLYTIIQFAVDQFGYSASGLSARSLMKEAIASGYFDAVGLNCGIGPGHMYKILKNLDLKEGMNYSALPNAGYPQKLSNRNVFNEQNKEYFVEKTAQFVELGVGIVGGCCGTDPQYIQLLSEKLEGKTRQFQRSEELESEASDKVEENGFFSDSIRRTKKGKLIAVELAPPVDANDLSLMEAVHVLKKGGADVLTFPDSPSGRTRVDSVLMAEKAHKETGICVMPHLCCRDKNAIAIRSSLMGAYINGIRNFLFITGDPVPTNFRQTVKSVFNFDATGLMKIAEEMNETVFTSSPVVYGGAINQNRRNFEVEIARVKKKLELGATFFFTQPVFDETGVARIRRVKEETGARILVGIMPFVSRRNATFMKNEMTGIDVPDEVIDLYEEQMTREAGEKTGVILAKKMIALTADFADGYYFSFPFNRVHMLDQILHS